MGARHQHFPSFSGSPLRWILENLFDLYPLERTSASYQRDLRPIVLEKGWHFGITVLSFRTFGLLRYLLANPYFLLLYIIKCCRPE